MQGQGHFRYLTCAMLALLLVVCSLDKSGADFDPVLVNVEYFDTPTPSTATLAPVLGEIGDTWNSRGCQSVPPFNCVLSHGSLLDSNGNQTSIHSSVTTIPGLEPQLYTGSGMPAQCDDNVIKKDFVRRDNYVSDPRWFMLTISNLTETAKYNLVLYAIHCADGYQGRGTTFTIDGVNKYTTGAFNPADISEGQFKSPNTHVVFENIKPDDLGRIVVVMTPEPSRTDAYLNAWQLERQAVRTEPPSMVPPANTPPIYTPPAPPTRITSAACCGWSGKYLSADAASGALKMTDRASDPGTEWRLTVSNGVTRIQTLASGRVFEWYLDVSTTSGTVKLHNDPGHTGTKWSLQEHNGFIRIASLSSGNLNGWYLDISTTNGTVKVHEEPGHTGTKWRLR